MLHQSSEVKLGSEKLLRLTLRLPSPRTHHRPAVISRQFYYEALAWPSPPTIYPIYNRPEYLNPYVSIYYAEISTFSFSNIFFFILGRKRIVFKFYSRRNWSVFIFTCAREKRPKSIRFQFFQKDLFSKIGRFQIEAFSCTIREWTLIFTKAYQIPTISISPARIAPKIKKCPRMSVWRVYVGIKKWRPLRAWF